MCTINYNGLNKVNKIFKDNKEEYEGKYFYIDYDKLDNEENNVSFYLNTLCAGNIIDRRIFNIIAFKIIKIYDDNFNKARCVVIIKDNNNDDFSAIICDLCLFEIHHYENTNKQMIIEYFKEISKDNFILLYANCRKNIDDLISN